MKPNELLAKQNEDSYQWVNTLIGSIPYQEWDRVPDVLETSVTWQVGHLIMSFYYHSVMVISGHQMELLKKIPMKEYDSFFTDGSPLNVIGKFNPEELHKQLIFVEEKSIEIIKSLAPENLESMLEPSQIPHPIARNKFEALDWNVKHTMWHCGQISILKRIINERYDFGLKKG